MKVVLFCGGMGMRLRDYSESIPKPMVCVGHRPILWNVMKYYAHYGHKEFILCLGYRSDTIKNYFLNYTECLSNDFTITNGGKDIYLYNNDISDWKITFADTGMTSNIGQRLKAVQKYLEDDEVFLANYSDGLTDFYLPDMIDCFTRSNKTACFLSVRPNQSFHIVNVADDGLVNDITGLERSDIWVNGGFFVLKKEIFDYIQDGDELVHEPFRRLIERKELLTYRYDGFWISMDTFKDKQHLDDLYSKGETPWEVWASHQQQP
ncbi:glucose-1-phosphate cytidylyltransferase [Geotalea uraniireducens]|uniref:Glucose-1-phosphate cytidylyltransferase n=1 Tax=Geotalea uraniireducens TaxID=351604 RepID=A0ABM8EKS9_9BACT|nr:sugar phosphate nucleotidyltransferase [Geotalea uraniireducens]BDV43043.1 glucose-1-phosphate cytidylyltransferase [Geotalea uraniireducens]